MLQRHSRNQSRYGRGHRAGVRRGDLGGQLAVDCGPAQCPEEGTLQRDTAKTLGMNGLANWPFCF